MQWPHARRVLSASNIERHLACTGGLRHHLVSHFVSASLTLLTQELYHGSGNHYTMNSPTSGAEETDGVFRRGFLQECTPLLAVAH